jgi:hypothetical protein
MDQAFLKMVDLLLETPSIVGLCEDVGGIITSPTDSGMGHLKGAILGS